MKKNQIKLFIGLVLIALIFILVYILMSHNNDNEEFDIVGYFNNEIDLKLLVYGDDIGLPEGLNYNQISNLEESSYAYDNDYVYLVINDLSGLVYLDATEIAKLVQYADKNTNFNFYYLGKNSLELVNSYVSEGSLNEDDLSVGYIMYQGYRVSCYGIWTEVEKELLNKNGNLLSESILNAIKMDIDANE